MTGLAWMNAALMLGMVVQWFTIRNLRKHLSKVERAEYNLRMTRRPICGPVDTNHLGVALRSLEDGVSALRKGLEGLEA